MKKISMALAVLFSAAVMIGCGADTAELAFKNGDAENLNNIVWESENKVWNSGWYASGQTTESKEVSDLNSSVVAEWDGGVGTVAAYFPETNSSSLSLSPGESYVYTIQH